MPKFATVRTSFAAGELSPLLHARSDTESYFNGAQDITNFIVRPQGALENRTGFEFIDEVRDSTEVARLIPFVFSTVQSYVIIFNDGYMRFFMDQSIVGAPYEVAHPYAAADLADLQFAQSADTLWIVHPSYKPRKVTRTGHTSWTIGNYAPTADPFTSANNYPSCVTFHEERLVFAASNNDPQKIWATVAGDYEDMTTGTGASDAYVYVISSGQINAIKWLFSAGAMLAGTSNGVFVMRASTLEEAITPTNVSVKRQITYGAKGSLPAMVQEVVMFVERLGKRLLGAQSPSGGSDYVSRDASIRANTITGDGITELAYQGEPDSILWAVRDDGYLVGATIEFNEQVLAWHKHNTGASGEFENICVLPSDTGDELWAVVKRTVDGGTVRYVELLKPRMDDLEDMVFMDSALSYDGSPVSSVSGLDHLEGEEVVVLADGAVHPSKTVASGAITLDYEASVVHVGLGYTSSVKTLPLAEGGIIGTALGMPKRVVALILKLYKSLGISIGPDDDNMTQIPFRTTSDDMDAPPPLFTGDKTVKDFPGGWDTRGEFVIKQTQPLPTTLLGAVVVFETNAGGQ